MTLIPRKLGTKLIANNRIISSLNYRLWKFTAHSYSGVVGEFPTNFWRGRIAWVSKRSFRSRASSSILNVGRKCRGEARGQDLRRGGVETRWGEPSATKTQGYRSNRPTKGSRWRLDNETCSRARDRKITEIAGRLTPVFDLFPWPSKEQIRSYVSQAHVAYASYRLYRETFHCEISPTEYWTRKNNIIIKL